MFCAITLFYLKNSRVKCDDLISITGECVEYHLAKDCRRATIAAWVTRGA